MLKGIFDLNNRFMTFISKAVDVLILGILWIALSVPVVTCGAASTAIYYTMIKNVRRDRGKLFREFFHAFKTNFRQSTILTLIILGYGLATCILVSFAGKLETGTALDAVYPVISGGILMIPFALTLPWVFPLLSRFEMTAGDLFKASFYFGIRNLGLTLALVAMLVSFGIIAYCMPFWIFVIPGIYTWVSTFLVEKGIMRYMKKYRNSDTVLLDDWQVE